MANTVTEIGLKLPNRPGQLAGVADALGKAKVNIQSLAAQASGGKGTVRLVFADKDVTRAKRALVRAGYRISKSGVRKVLAVSLVNKPGTLARATSRLAKAGVNIDTLYMLKQTKKSSVAAFGVRNIAKAKKAL